jgi:hypothetical protein
MRSIEECARAFIDELRNDKRRRPFDVSDENTWLDSAIIASQGQGNPKDSRLRIKDPVKALMNQHLKQWQSKVVDDNLVGYHQFEKLTRESFESIHSLSEIMDPGCLLLFGRVQKIHNIWLKYQIALYYSGYSSQYTKANPGIGKLLQFAHVPIDNVVLSYIDDNELAPSSVTRIGTLLMDWKLKLQEPRYMTLQDILRSAAHKNGYKSSLHFEMDLIWSP